MPALVVKYDESGTKGVCVEEFKCVFQSLDIIILYIIQTGADRNYSGAFVVGG